jgi:hypothetical protein
LLPLIPAVGVIHHADDAPLLASAAMNRASEFGVPYGGYRNTRWQESWPPRIPVGEPLQDMFTKQDFANPGRVVDFSSMRDTPLGQALQDLPRVNDQGFPEILVTRYNYVIDVNGTVRVARSGHHSDLVQGANVLGAGEMYLDTSGRFRYINDWSGHYQPSGSQFGGFLQEILSNQGLSPSPNVYDWRR